MRLSVLELDIDLDKIVTRGRQAVRLPACDWFPWEPVQRAANDAKRKQGDAKETMAVAAPVAGPPRWAGPQHPVTSGGFAIICRVFASLCGFLFGLAPANEGRQAARPLDHS